MIPGGNRVCCKGAGSIGPRVSGDGEPGPSGPGCPRVPGSDDRRRRAGDAGGGGNRAPTGPARHRWSSNLGSRRKPVHPGPIDPAPLRQTPEIAVSIGGRMKGSDLRVTPRALTALLGLALVLTARPGARAADRPEVPRTVRVAVYDDIGTSRNIESLIKVLGEYPDLHADRVTAG